MDEQRLFESKALRTLIPYVYEHGHQYVVGQIKAIAIREDGIPQQQQIQQHKLAPKEQAQPAADNWKMLRFLAWFNGGHLHAKYMQWYFHFEQIMM